MSEEELNNWYCHLTVVDKEKVVSKEQYYMYPACVGVWLNLTTEEKLAAYNRF